MIKEIHNMILEDNAQSGVRSQGPIPAPINPSLPVGRARENNSISPRPLSMPDTPTIDVSRNQELHLQTPTGHLSLQSNQPTRPMSQPLQPFSARRERPPVQPKPRNLQLHISQQLVASRPTSKGDDALAERFSQLRIPRNDILQPHASDAAHRNSVELSSSTEYTPSSSDDSSFNHSHGPDPGGPTSPTKLLGPRSMPKASEMPTVPPKIPLSPLSHNDYQSLPQPPKPAYDPAKTAMNPINTNTTAFNRKRSIIGIGDKPFQSSGLQSGQQTLANGVAPPARSSSVQLPQPFILAKDLYDQFQTSNILVIDVRSREHYDSGHILATNTMCIEPVGIQYGMSAEELEERLTISPGSEQLLFEKRDKFDLVVYHDQCTQSDRFLKGPPTMTEANHLRALHDTLFEFNHDKPLRKRPLVLLGGLESWVDLVGPQALAFSKTAASVDSTGIRRSSRRPNRPTGRVPTASSNSSLEVRKRRLREQKHLNPDEERRWLEKAHKEEVNPEEYLTNRSDGDPESNDEEPPSPFIHSYEDFLRRFPEPGPVQQSMYSLPPPPSKLSNSHSPPRSIPSAPSRPPPAVPRPSYSGVSDREISQYSPISRQASATQQPFYTSRSVSHYRKLPRTGLVNFGVTCYMNATIQCLLATIPLSQFFLADQWRNLTQKNWKGSNGILPGIFANLIRSLWKDDDRPIRPTSLRSFCARLKDEWGVDRQQDAKEFFDFIVDCLHEDLNLNFDNTPLENLTERQEMVRESLPIRKAAKTEWERYSHRESSYISDLFAGQHASRLRCTTCNNTSTTYEAFYSISVEIPRQNPKRGMWDIHNCLRSYCQEEKLSGDEVWKCPHCKCEREATKQITITRAPQFLVVHFKRFEMRKGDAKKVHTPINFPLYGLDLGEYMVRSDTSTRSRSEEPLDMATTAPYMYDAYAVMRHIGSSGSGGHYISMVRDAARSCWRKFDDDRANDFDPGKLKGDKILQNDQAYLVFYGRAVAR